ncbi:hypothetical protein CERZMDRAFT_91650 [Cercospora zeae-maydis SCOH1-5]|uniref:Secreted protein n=1 Tax=Cercospora zeae-maydis SCOH1-5 TaxID=717836 RepID=A0A6A6F6T9_9PEZI|nr:hypothetical protein CERZMDRAFT_91650 [Cercospora zeae-maydis SCOH1-5]
MKTTSILAMLGSMLSLQGVSADCYGSGDRWPNTEEARAFVWDACHADGGMFTGYFAARQTKSMCPRSGGKGLLFEVQNMNTNTGFDLGNDDCYNRLSNEIFGCVWGGQSEVSGWRFRADPGNC